MFLLLFISLQGHFRLHILTFTKILTFNSHLNGSRKRDEDGLRDFYDPEPGAVFWYCRVSFLKVYARV